MWQDTGEIIGIDCKTIHLVFLGVEGANDAFKILGGPIQGRKCNTGFLKDIKIQQHVQWSGSPRKAVNLSVDCCFLDTHLRIEIQINLVPLDIWAEALDRTKLDEVIEIVIVDTHHIGSHVACNHDHELGMVVGIPADNRLNLDIGMFLLECLDDVLFNSDGIRITPECILECHRSAFL
ncbi:hypothetical protein DSECCO2_447250 [anaerobic digester metagenome]